MIGSGFSQSAIANMIGRHKSVVCRELKRNCAKRNGLYKHDLAQRKYEHRQKLKPKKRYFTEAIKNHVEGELAKKLSPEQIAGKAKASGRECVSAERIYLHVWRDKKLGGTLHEHLRTRGKRYRKRGSKKDKRGMILQRRDISERPQVVENRERVGDLEIDTIIGKNGRGAIVTINDRAAGWLKMKKLESKNADVLSAETIKLLWDWKPYLHTITSDNGKEFAAHKTISERVWK